MFCLSGSAILSIIQDSSEIVGQVGSNLSENERPAILLARMGGGGGVDCVYQKNPDANGDLFDPNYSTIYNCK